MADVDTVPQVTFKKRAAKATARKRQTTPPPASDSDSGFESSEDENGRQIKRRKKNAGVVAASTSNGASRAEERPFEITAAAATRQSNSDNATMRSNWFEDEHDKSHVVKPGDNAVKSAPDGTYKGAASYQSFIQKNPERQTNVGPQKLNSNVRTITVTDFAPDVCKDYKQTGFCGFGDSCKFLHAREDYKQGWQLDRDWEVDTKGKKLAGRTVASANRSAKNAELDEDDEKLLESIPFACIICKKAYRNPIITKCNHYFCEPCALERYKKNPSCAACGTGTGGVFNVAKKLNRLLDKKREQQRQKREKAIENGEKVPDEEAEPAPA
ncbi:RNA-splicing factor [Knufia obscura]|uniref:Pre-mRNA-splicing factor CWC24 n=2 Tax=Knufia TaxID=430999 RepID=A0AAN8I822_9EURO|nr:RNA-splicing factor [Knufia obscura]KAK5954006.1 RNA-splicing factor [Knufia fluminis]